MAQEVLGAMAGAVIAGAKSFLRVDYQMLGLEMLTMSNMATARELPFPSLSGLENKRPGPFCGRGSLYANQIGIVGSVP
jgi:hypothetical protein